MARKLDAREAIDVSRCRRTAVGDYILQEFDENVDYCDAATETWIWSIGKILRPLPSVMADGSRETLPAGAYLASPSSRHYTAAISETIQCVWLR